MVFKCEICGYPIKEGGKTVICPNCGAIYSNCYGCYGVGSPDPGLGDLFIGILFGAIIIAPFIWVPVVRAWAIETISKAVKASKKQVEKWLDKGAKESAVERKAEAQKTEHEIKGKMEEWAKKA